MYLSCLERRETKCEEEEVWRMGQKMRGLQQLASIRQEKWIAIDVLLNLNSFIVKVLMDVSVWPSHLISQPAVTASKGKK